MADPLSSQRRALVLAVVALLVVKHIVPFGRLLLYPFTLMATWVHEMGHGITALVLGGRFSQLEIFGNAAGLAHCAVTRGWRDGLVALGGLLGPPLIGSAILFFARGPRSARIVLALFAGGLAVSTAIWVRSAAGVLAMPAVAILLALAAWRLSEKRRFIASQALALLLALDTLARADYLFTGMAEIDGAKHTSDVAAISEAFGGHYLLWGLLIAAFDLALLALALWRAWRRPAPIPKTTMKTRT